MSLPFLRVLVVAALSAASCSNVAEPGPTGAAPTVGGSPASGAGNVATSGSGGSSGAASSSSPAGVGGAGGAGAGAGVGGGWRSATKEARAPAVSRGSARAEAVVMPPLVPLALVARGSFVKISRAARSIRRFGESRYSVMTTTVAEAIKWAILRKLRVVNLSAGTDVSKTRWRPHVVTTCSGVLLAPHRSARLKWHLAKRVEENGREGAWLSRVVKLARRRG